MLHCIVLSKICPGRLAQLGERCVRNAEVRGSIPLPSTNFLRNFAISDAVDASSSVEASDCDLVVTTAGKSNALIFRSSVECVYRASMRVELWPEIAITV